MNVGTRVHTQTQMVQSGSIRVVRTLRFRRPQHIAEVTIVVLNVRSALDSKTILAKSEIQQCPIIKIFRPLQVRNGDIDVIDADNFIQLSCLFLASSQLAARSASLRT